MTISNDGMTLTFTVEGRDITIRRPAPGADLPSFFALGLPKAGSTLLGNVMTGVAERIGLRPFSLDSALHVQGVKPRHVPDSVATLFSPRGFAYVGFRIVPLCGLPGFASGRTVSLIRDPRDMLVSLYFSLGFSHVAPGAKAGETARTEFDATRSAIRQTPIDDWVLANHAPTLGQFRRLMAAERTTKIRHWRYEDIIFDKARWLADMLGHLAIDLDPATQAAILAPYDIRPKDENPGRHVRKVSPGDHLDKLQPATITELNRLFAPVLTGFGYPDDARQS